MKHLVRPDPRPATTRYQWTCPTCNRTGWSATRHGALARLHTHWRSCPDPRRGASL